MVLYIFDLIGVFAFSVFAAYDAHDNRFDLFGMFVCALLCSMGGGTIREMLLGNIPIYLTDINYLIVVVMGMSFAILIYKHFHRVRRMFLVFDAVGLVTFAMIGATRADAYHLSSIAIVFFAAISAVGGGILKDIAMNKVPHIFSKDFYATPAILFGLFYALFREQMQYPLVLMSLAISIFVLRIVAIKYNFHLWSRKEVAIVKKKEGRVSKTKSKS